MNPFYPISISLSPNTEKDDIQLALKLIFQPKIWMPSTHPPEEKKIQELENKFKKYLGIKYSFSFNSGRASLMAILDAINIKEGDEVLLQAFTCNAAVNPILNRGAKPIFVDIDETINLDPDDLKKKISPRTKAVIIQHTFGWPASINEILEIVKKNNLFLIEDCAHSLGAKYKGRLCGTFGDAAFFSFGRDKIISSVYGGIAVTNNGKIADKIKKFQDKAGYPSSFWIFQQLLHPILVNYFVLPAYGLHHEFGRILLGLSHKVSILSKAVYKKEKKGEIPKYFPKKLPPALSILALNQFKKLDRFNEHRREIANFYEKELKNTNFILPLTKPGENRVPTFMRYPILVNFNTDKILKRAKKKKILLNDGWRKKPVVPPDTDICKMRYPWGSCSLAEKVAKNIINLPTHINISKREAARVVNFLKQF